MKSPWTSAPPSRGGNPGGTDLAIRAQPRASRSEIVGVHGDRLKVRLAAPPVEGAANRELVKVLARALEVPRNRLEVVHGHSSRDKTVRIAGFDPEEVQQRLSLG